MQVIGSKNDNPNPAKGDGIRIVIIGGVAGGGAVAARLMRLNNKLNVTMIERGPHVSIASCGLPYFIGGEIKDGGELHIHTPTSLQNAMGVTKVLVSTEATAIDRKRKVVTTRSIASTTDSVEHGEIPYDFLVIATGASPIIPPFAEEFLITKLPQQQQQQTAASVSGRVKRPNVSHLLAKAGGNGSNKNNDTNKPATAIHILRDIADVEGIVKNIGGNTPVTATSTSTNKNNTTTATGDDSNKQKTSAPPIPPTNVTIVGAGFIGLEIAEQISKLGHSVTLVERQPCVLPVLDDEMGALLHDTIREKGIKLMTNEAITSMKEVGGSKDSNAPRSTSGFTYALTTASGKNITANVVILCVGVRAESRLARKCGLKITNPNSQSTKTDTAAGAPISAIAKPPVVVNTNTTTTTSTNTPVAAIRPNQLICVDNYMRTSDHSIYAVGDAVEVSDGVFRDVKTWTPLATVAAMEGRIAADHIVLGKSIPFRGTFSTAIVRVFGQAAGCTGWSEKRLKLAKIPYAVSVVNAWGSASYYPGAMPLLIKITYCPTTGRLFGGQAVGYATAQVDKRLDVIATALLGNLTIFELSHGQFSYSPPFNSAKDPVTIACLNARNITADGLTNAATRLDPTATMIDVRPKAAFDNPKAAIATAVPNQPKKHLFWATSKEGSKKLLEEGKLAAAAAAGGNNNNGLSPSGSSTSNNTPAVAPNRYQSVCFWGRTSYFAHRNMLQAGITKATTLQGGNVYGRALKEAEACGSKL